MRSYSSILLASALALGTIAKPLDKRVLVTEIDLEIVTVTRYVTAGEAVPTSVSKEEASGYQTPEAPAPSSSQAAPAPSFPSDGGYAVPSSSPAPAPEPTSSSVYVAPPEPSTSSVYVPPPEPSTSATPEPTPEPEPTTSQDPPAATPVYGVEHTSGDDQAFLHEGAEYEDAMLWHHNRARANHGAANLEWSSDCAAAAANAAAFCDFEHHVVDGQGQNLFTVSGEAYNATAGVTESWYKAEADIYGAFDGTPNMATFHDWGHLTQVLWKKTTHLGCATINCGSKMTINGAPSELGLYTVCNYSPPGNYEGEYAENVASPVNSYSTFSWAD